MTQNMSLCKDSYEGFPIKDAILEKNMYSFAFYFYMLAIHMICILLLQFANSFSPDEKFYFLKYHHTHIRKQFEWCKYNITFQLLYCVASIARVS